jgi:hypothetical protein
VSAESPNTLPKPEDQPAQKPPAPRPTGRQPQPTDADHLKDVQKAGSESAGVARTDRQPNKPAVGAPDRGTNANNARQPTAPAKGPAQPGRASTTAQQPAPGTARQPTLADVNKTNQAGGTNSPRQPALAKTPQSDGTDKPDSLATARGEALYTSLKQGIERSSPEALRAGAEIANAFYHRDYHADGSMGVAVSRNEVTAAAKQAEISPESLQKMIDLVRPFAPKSDPAVMDSVLQRDPYNADRYVEVGRVGPASTVRSEKAAGQQAAIESIKAGLLTALAGLRPGATSAGLVPPRGGAANGPPRTYDARIGDDHPAPSPYGGLVPPKPGEQNTNRGFQNELQVANLTGGRLARDPSQISNSGAVKDASVSFTRSNGQNGSVAVDVFGPNGELILVGGPSKQQNMSKTIQRLTDLKLGADAKGVGAAAYFTNDTPQQVIQQAQRVLGAGNVHVFARPQYKQP